MPKCYDVTELRVGTQRALLLLFQRPRIGACAGWGAEAMAGNVVALLAMAAKYQELAGVSTDPAEREKLRQYAALYREMAAQASTGQRLAMEQAARPS